MRKQSWKISQWVHLDGFEYASYEVYLGYGICLQLQKPSYTNTNVYMINTSIIMLASRFLLEFSRKRNQVSHNQGMKSLIYIKINK